MDQKLFDKFRAIVYDKAGIALGDSKQALVSARVGKRLRALQIDDLKSYLKFVEQDKSGEEVVHLLDVISTNVTNFYREPEHFKILADTVKKLASNGQKRLRIWSAACSTGEEPYTIAITLLETLRNTRIDVKILATDISTRVLKQCRTAVYDKRKMEGMPAHLRDRYFISHRNGKSNLYEANIDIRKMVKFSRINLSKPPFPMKGPFDVVFCRNVMIYFDNPVRKRLLTEINRVLKPGGLLMVGHAESLTGIVSDFKSIKPSVYIKV